MKNISTEDFRKIMPTMQPEIAAEVCLANLATDKEHSLEDKVVGDLTFRHVITALNGTLEQITSLKQFLHDIFEAGVESGLISETEVISDAGVKKEEITGEELSAKQKVEEIREKDK